MALAREAIVICVDVGPHMRLRDEEIGATALEQALECIHWILQRKIFGDSKDEFAVVLLGTTETKNALADDSDGGYTNISTVRQFKVADWNLVKYCQNEISSLDLTVPADFVDAMAVSLDLLLRAEQNKKYSGKQLVIFSNLCAPFGDDQVDKIVKAIKNSGVELILFGPRLYLSDDENGYGDYPHEEGGAGRLKKTAQQELGERHMTKILNQVDGQVYSFREGLSLLNKFTMRSVRPTPWKCNIELAQRIKIPICMYVKTKKAKIKQSWKWSHAQDPDTEISMQRTYHKTDVRDGFQEGGDGLQENADVPSTKPKYPNVDEDEAGGMDDTQASAKVPVGREVEKEDLIKVFNYGTTAVPLDKLDLEAMKYKNTEKCLKILAFIEMKQAKRQYFLGDGCHLVFSEVGDEEGSTAFLAFWKGMRRENRAALVRYAYSARSAPRLGVLIPTTGGQQGDGIPCFMFVTFPFAEDCRTFEFPSLNDPKLEPSAEQLKTIDDLITAMDLTGALVDENGRRCEAYDPLTVVDPHIQHTYACLSHRALLENQPLPPVNSQLVASISPLEERMQLAKPVFEKLRTMFELKKREDKRAKRTATDIFQPGEGSAGLPPQKIYRGEHNQAEAPTAVVITSVRPVEEYAALVEQNGSIFEAASEKLESIIAQFIFDAVDTQFYHKAADCVEIYRRKSIEMPKPGVFNNWMRNLKRRLDEDGKQDFLLMLSTRGLGLISCDECASSHVTADEAKAFFEPEEKPNKEEVIDAPADNSDLLDELE